MSAVRITSKNAGISNEDHIKEAAERLYTTLMIDITAASVDYAEKVKEGEIENSEESFLEHLRLKPYVGTETNAGSKIPAGKATNILRSGGTTNGRGAGKAKDLTDAQLKMYHEINNDEWDFHWKPHTCQRFITSGTNMNTFCTAKPASNEYFCKKCITMPSTGKLMEYFVKEGLTPEMWFEEKKAKCMETAAERIGLEKGQSVKKDAPKQVARAPPSSKPPARMTSASGPVLRKYQGKGKPEVGFYWWARIPGIDGGCVFTEELKLIGKSLVGNVNGDITPATAAETTKFEKISATIKFPENTVKKPQPPAKTEEVEEEEDVEEELEEDEVKPVQPIRKPGARAPPMPANRTGTRVVRKQVSEEEEEEIIDMEETD